MAMIAGEYPSGVFYNAFANPTTGEYNVAAVAEVLSQSEGNLQMQQMWNYLNSQALLERQLAK